jgi:hypothetical protein
MHCHANGRSRATFARQRVFLHPLRRTGTVWIESLTLDDIDNHAPERGRGSPVAGW